MELGYHTVNVLDKEIVKKPSGSVMFNLKVEFDNGETSIGSICLQKRDQVDDDGKVIAEGDIMDKNIEDVRKIFGWNDDSLETLMSIPCDGIQVTVIVREEEYNGRIGLKIGSIYPIRKKASAEDIKSLSNKFKKVLKTTATTSSIGKLEKPKPTQKVDDKPKNEEKSPSIITFEAFKKAFSFITEESLLNAKWFQFIGEVKGELFDTDNATRDDWKDLYKAIGGFKEKCMKEQEEETVSDGTPF